MDEVRKKIINGFFILIAVIYVVRLFFLQVVDESYKLDAQNNAIRKIVQTPFRGLIYDRNHKLIVYNTPVYDLYITPKKAKVQDTLRFCNLFNISRSTFDSLTHLARVFSPVRPSLFIRQMSIQDYAKVQDAMVDYPGFSFQMSSIRTYQHKTMANALGYVGEISPERLEKQTEDGEDSYYRQGDYVGVTGLERFYEEELRGQRGEKYVMVNSRGIEKGPFRNGAFDRPPVSGKSLISSIDIELQDLADSLMQHKVGSVVAIQPQTGEVLAMVSAPTYDPSMLAGRTFSKYFQTLNLNPLHPLINRPPSAYYRPGSTFKLIQALIALQMGVITSGTGFGHGGAPLKCHCAGNSSNLMMGIKNSCNPYFYQTFKRIIYNNNEHNLFKKSAEGVRRWNEMASKFGIGQKLDVDLPNETSGKLPSVDYYNQVYKGALTWKFSNIYSLGIGEGELIINPLKMANVAAIIANRGWYIRPHLVKGIGKAGAIDPKYKEKVSVGIAERHFAPVIEGMVGAVNAGTVAAEARMSDIQMCGKTGTSQNRIGEDHAIFIAFAPKENPKIAIAVFVENAGFGGSSAAPIASLCIEKYIKRKVERKAMEERWKNKSYLGNVLSVLSHSKGVVRKPKPKAYELLKTTRERIFPLVPEVPKRSTIKVPMMSSEQIAAKEAIIATAKQKQDSLIAKKKGIVPLTK